MCLTTLPRCSLILGSASHANAPSAGRVSLPRPSRSGDYIQPHQPQGYLQAAVQRDCRSKRPPEIGRSVGHVKAWGVALGLTESQRPATFALQPPLPLFHAPLAARRGGPNSFPRPCSERLGGLQRPCVHRLKRCGPERRLCAFSRSLRPGPARPARAAHRDCRRA